MNSAATRHAHSSRTRTTRTPECQWLGGGAEHWEVRRLKTRLCSRSALYGANVAATSCVRDSSCSISSDDGHHRMDNSMRRGVFLPQESVGNYRLAGGRPAHLPKRNDHVRSRSCMSDEYMVPSALTRPVFGPTSFHARTIALPLHSFVHEVPCVCGVLAASRRSLRRSRT